jgi:hypothetical protein
MVPLSRGSGPPSTGYQSQDDRIRLGIEDDVSSDRAVGVISSWEAQMRTFGIAFASLGILGVALAGSTPATAQPVEATVRGGQPGITERELGPTPGFEVRPGSVFSPHITGPLAPDFDPSYYAQAEGLRMLARNPNASVDLVLGAILDQNDETPAEHMLRCQARYPNYEPVSNTYLAANGVPRPCF